MLRVVPGSIPGETPSFACRSIYFCRKNWEIIDVESGNFLQVENFGGKAWSRCSSGIVRSSCACHVHVVCFGQQHFISGKLVTGSSSLCTVYLLSIFWDVSVIVCESNKVQKLCFGSQQRSINSCVAARKLFVMTEHVLRLFRNVFITKSQDSMLLPCDTHTSVMHKPFTPRQSHRTEENMFVEVIDSWRYIWGKKH